MAANSTSDQKRYQVFVSSTYVDLQEERRAVISTLLESDAFPAGMEMFPASDDDAWSLIKGVIDDSDYYLVVIGGKYGSLDPAEDISFTEKEFDYAVATRKPVMAFMHGDPNALTVEKSEKSEDMQEKLANFRDKVKSSKHVKFWTTPEDLAGKVALSFNKLTRQFPAVGWIRADRAASVESLTELAASKARVLELEDELRTVQSAPPPGTEDLSQGDDPISMPVAVSASYRGASLHRVTELVRWDTTWDEVLGSVAPTLIPEGDQSDLEKALSDAAHFEIYGEAVETTRAEAQKLDETITARASPRDLKVEMYDDTFGTVLMQLKALGLIEPSTRRRSVNDKGTYWSLTPLGEQRAITVRALRKQEDGIRAMIG
ncbi:DUF4062 domain-containing protein [Microbacterium enclense]|uniref:DUF4062 domain-containing protein n=1 Tax=Microbacterium enclense TaxID=993073 RepID=UPI00343BFAA6